MPGHLEQSLAEEEHDRGVVRGPELTVDRQAQHIAVEAPAPVQVERAHQDTAAEYLHTVMLAPLPVAGYDCFNNLTRLKWPYAVRDERTRDDLCDRRAVRGRAGPGVR